MTKKSCWAATDWTPLSQARAAALAGRVDAWPQVAVPPTWYRAVITFASFSSAGSMAQVRPALRPTGELPTASSWFSRPPLARLAWRLLFSSAGQAA